VGREPTWIPWESKGTWDYSKETPDGIEQTQSCKECEKCKDGRCVWNEGECGPCVVCEDVHISTLDRLRYDFQAAGEFVLYETQSQDHVVQIRTEPYGTHVTVNTAVAMRVAGDTIAIHRRPELLVAINGDPVSLVEGEVRELPGGGRIKRNKYRFSIIWPDRSVVQARLHGKHLDVGTRVADVHAGQMSGLVGNFDGDPHNDLRTREGEQLTRQMDRAILYSSFGNSWRISQEESLFAYVAGESTATYQLLDFPPPRPVRLLSLDAATLAFAEEACRQQGIEHPRLFRDCVYDVAMTGDAGFALEHGRSSAPVASVPVNYFDGETPGQISLDAPGSVIAGSRFEVQWSGEVRIGDFVAIAQLDADLDTYLAYSLTRPHSSVSLGAPDTPGDYEIRYIQGEHVAASLQFEVEPVSASLEAPVEAQSGQRIDVRWQGPGGQRDYIAVAEASASAGSYHHYRYTENGSPVALYLPDEPGSYQIRYVQHQSRTVLATREITVLPVKASLDAPTEIQSGGELIVTWTGPGNTRDYIAIADPSASPGTYSHYRYTSSNPVYLKVPEEPGTYEIRYVQGQSKTVLATLKVRVVSQTSN
jgi:hypothetical protein